MSKYFFVIKVLRVKYIHVFMLGYVYEDSTHIESHFYTISNGKNDVSERTFDQVQSKGLTTR